MPYTVKDGDALERITVMMGRGGMTPYFDIVQDVEWQACHVGDTTASDKISNVHLGKEPLLLQRMGPHNRRVGQWPLTGVAVKKVS